VTTLVRDDAGGKAERVADLMQVIAELTNECFFSARTGQEPSIGRQRIKGTKELEASDESVKKPAVLILKSEVARNKKHDVQFRPFAKALSRLNDKDRNLLLYIASRMAHQG
jgi:hypothetical protein